MRAEAQGDYRRFKLSSKGHAKGQVVQKRGVQRLLHHSY